MKRVLPVVLLAVAFQFACLSAGATYVTMTKIGEGTVSPNVGSNDLGFLSRVTIRATPAAGWVFDRWGGDMAGKSNPYSFYLTANKTAIAYFRPATATPSNALVRYVGKYDASSGYVINDSDTHFSWDSFEITVTSGHWRSTTEVDRNLWQHDMVLAVPWFSGDDCLYLINGGSNPLKHPSPDSTYATVAIALGVKYAQIDQVPNQPLYFADEVNNSRTEDEILAYSMDKYLLTGDQEWPVHEAMVRAGVEGMNAIQHICNECDDFLVLGASKRGWTTWLTTAIDPRVKWVLPIVIDVLNFPEQVENHWESLGLYSGAIQDYVDFDLFCRCHNDPMAPSLLNIVDPYTYINKFTMPKYIVNASGDQFFLSDSSKFYLPAMPGQTWLRYVPNKDHYMEGVLDDYNNLLGLLTWGVNEMNGTANPTYSWQIVNGQIVVTTSSGPDEVNLWQATNPNSRDFRLETQGEIWTSSSLFDQGGGTYVGYCPPPASGFTAFFVELKFGLQTFTSQIIITPDYLPYDGMGCFQ